MSKDGGSPCDEANAQLIVTAVNSHAALVGALEGLLGLRCIKAVETIGEADANKASEAVKDARAALALAGKVEVLP